MVKCKSKPVVESSTTGGVSSFPQIATCSQQQAAFGSQTEKRDLTTFSCKYRWKRKFPVESSRCDVKAATQRSLPRASAQEFFVIR